MRIPDTHYSAGKKPRTMKSIFKANVHTKIKLVRLINILDLLRLDSQLNTSCYSQYSFG